MVLRNAFENLAVEAKQDSANTKLDAILTELLQKLEAGQAVALDATTLAALESVSAVVSGTVAISNFPGPDEAGLTNAELRAVPVPVSGAVDSPARQLELDYQSRADSQPVYLGKAPLSALDTDSAWTITKFVYASSTDNARLVRSNVVESGAWTDRLTLLP